MRPSSALPTQSPTPSPHPVRSPAPRGRLLQPGPQPAPLLVAETRGLVLAPTPSPGVRVPRQGLHPVSPSRGDAPRDVCALKTWVIGFREKAADLDLCDCPAVLHFLETQARELGHLDLIATQGRGTGLALQALNREIGQLFRRWEEAIWNAPAHHREVRVPSRLGIRREAAMDSLVNGLNQLRAAHAGLHLPPLPNLSGPANKRFGEALDSALFQLRQSRRDLVKDDCDAVVEPSAPLHDPEGGGEPLQINGLEADLDRWCKLHADASPDVLVARLEAEVGRTARAVAGQTSLHRGVTVCASGQEAALNPLVKQAAVLLNTLDPASPDTAALRERMTAALKATVSAWEPLFQGTIHADSLVDRTSRLLALAQAQ